MAKMAAPLPVNNSYGTDAFFSQINVHFDTKIDPVGNSKAEILEFIDITMAAILNGQNVRHPGHCANGPPSYFEPMTMENPQKKNGAFVRHVPIHLKLAPNI